MPKKTEISLGDVAARADKAEGELRTERMTLNVGPSHPTTHGVLRLLMELDGDIITQCEPVIGYLHRGDEKIAENMTYNQFVPYTDRLDYLAPLAGFAAGFFYFLQVLDQLFVQRLRRLPEGVDAGGDLLRR